MMELIVSKPLPAFLLLGFAVVALMVIVAGYRSRKHAKRLAADPEYQRLIEAHERNCATRRAVRRAAQEECGHYSTSVNGYSGQISCNECDAGSDDS